MNKSLGWVGAAFVLLAGLVALGVIWVPGLRAERESTEFASWVRTPASLLVLLVSSLATLELRHRPSVRFLVMLGLLQLSIAGAYGFALVLAYGTHSGTVK